MKNKERANSAAGQNRSEIKDQSASELLSEYYPKLTILARRTTTEEMHQDALLIVGVKILLVCGQNFDPSKKVKFWTYAEKAIRREMGRRATELRKMDLIVRPLSELSESNSDEGAPSNEKFLSDGTCSRDYANKADAAELALAVEELPKGQRQVVEETYFKGRSFADQARNLGISRAAITLRHKAALENLKQRIA